MLRRKLKTIEIEPKPKKVKVVSYGKNTVLRSVIWSIFITGFAFAVYKNFTAVDTHTVHETKIVEQVVQDTSGMTSFLKQFAESYFSWDGSAESLEAQKNNLLRTTTSELAQLNHDMRSAELEKRTSSRLTDFKIWALSEMDETSYRVIFTASQYITRVETTVDIQTVEETQPKEVKNPETGAITYEDEVVQKQIEVPVENTVELWVTNCYMTVLHVDEAGNMVVVQSPTIYVLPEKSEYAPKAVNPDTSITSAQKREMDEFLNKFFALYPAADKKELSYYVKNSALPVLAKELQYVGMISVVYVTEEEHVKAHVTVKYTDASTGIDQISQYILGLEKKENWNIVSSNFEK